MRVLVTGAAGEVADGVVRLLERHYDLRLLDLRKAEAFPHHEWLIGSILDRDLLESAVQDVQTIVHCAIARKGKERDVTTEQFFDVNVKGLYLLLEAAEMAGMAQLVHVSSTATIIGHWYTGEQITVDSPYTTRGRYSLTKMLQEQICAHVARNSNIKIVALRPWAPREGLLTTNEAGEQIPRPYHPGLIDRQDFGEACRLAIEAKNLGSFEIFHIVATQEARSRFDSERTERMLGFRAKEDFESLKNNAT